MSSSLAEKLDLLVSAFSNIEFSPSGSNLDAFTFQVGRENHTVIFRHGELEIRVGNFRLMDDRIWSDKLKGRRVIDDNNKWRELWYEAEVKLSVGGISNVMRLPLGHEVYRDSLTAPLGTMQERVIINDLLFRIEHWLASTFGEELLSPQISKNTVREMDGRSDSLGRRVMRVLGLS